MKNLLKVGSTFILILSFLSIVILPGTVSAQGFVGPCPTGTYNNGTGCVPGGAGVTYSGASAVVCPTSSIAHLICTVQQILNSVLPVMLALGVVYFVWGVVQYVIGDSDEAKKKGRDHIIWGIIGFAIIIGLFGIINLVVSTFGFGAAANLNVPTLQVTTTAANAGSNCPVGTNLQTFIGFIICLIDNSIIPFIFAIAVLMFIWGIVQFFILGSDEESKRSQGKQFMIWGIIALVVMMGVWGLVSILGGTFGLNTSVLPHVTPPGASSQ